VTKSFGIIVRAAHCEINIAQAREQHFGVLVAAYTGRYFAGIAADGPLEEIIDVVANNKSVVFARKSDEGFSTAQRHGLARGVGACRYSVNDMAIMLAVLSSIAQRRLIKLV
jgi:hypothetical protein